MTNSTDLIGAFSPEAFWTAVGISKSTFYDLVKTGQLRAVKCGRRTLITQADAGRWLSSLPALQLIPLNNEN